MSFAPHKAAAILGLDQVPTLEGLEAYWREKAPGWHPDHGGDAETFQEKLFLYRALREHLQAEESKCPYCKGHGKVEEGRGFVKLALGCSVCRGTGKRKP